MTRKCLISSIFIFAIAYSLYTYFFAQMVVITGDRSFEGALVYEGNSLVAKMVFDPKSKRTYAQDINLIDRYPLDVSVWTSGTRIDSLKMNTQKGDYEFKVIKRNKEVYIQSFRSLESLSYMSYDLNTFHKL